MWNGSVQVMDTVKIFLRNNIFPFNAIDSSKAYLSNSGNATVNFDNASNGNYFIQVIHRNAMETWSSSANAFSKGTVLNYNFTSSQSKAFGNNQVLNFSRWCAFSGDVNNDGTIDASDLSSIENDVSVSNSGYIKTDLNGDDFADGSDVSLAENNVAGSVNVIDHKILESPNIFYSIL